MPSAALRAVAKHVCKFHGAIAEVLAPADVKALLERAHAAFTYSLRVHLTRLGVVNDGGPQHGSVPAQFSLLALLVALLSFLNGPCGHSMTGADVPFVTNAWMQGMITSNNAR